MQVARYSAGQRYVAHHDSFFSESPAQREHLGGSRIGTLLVYLTSAAAGAGGETDFAQANPPLRATPVAGDALVFFPSVRADAADRPGDDDPSLPALLREQHAWMRKNTRAEAAPDEGAPSPFHLVQLVVYGEFLRTTANGCVE